MAGYSDRDGGRLRRIFAADHRVRACQPDAAVQLDWKSRMQSDRQPAASDHVVQGRLATDDGSRPNQRYRLGDPSNYE